MQVDERATIDLGDVYNAGREGVMATVYTDPGTWTGPDTDPSFDVDDELVLMARDAGEAAPIGAGDPDGVVARSRVTVVVADPLGGGRPPARVYLYRRARRLDPGAGRRYVDYRFSLASGDYRRTYRIEAGPNPEDSTVRTPFYTRHFSDRWLTDELAITAPGASGVDILDRHRNLFMTGYGGRAEDSFDAGEGAFITNRSGPVRGIRSVIGANSGPYITKTWVFYDRREDVTVDLRVHPIPSIIDYDDLSPDAMGMTYRDAHNLDGVTIDGAPDDLVPGPPQWHLIDGPQGTMHVTPRLLTDTGVGPSPPTTRIWPRLTRSSAGATTPPTAPSAAGSTSGSSTPTHGSPTRTLQHRSVITYGPPGMSAQDASDRGVYAATPLVATAAGPHDKPPIVPR